MTSKKIAVILNSNQLGGAERSLIEQLSGLRQTLDFFFFVPALSLSSQELSDFIQKKGFTNIRSYTYPSFFYQLSRRDIFKVLLLPIFLPVFLWTLLKWHCNFRHFSTFYVNGNKASFPVLSWSLLFFRKVKIYWHFRDFPENGYFKIIRVCLDLSHRFTRRTLVVIANSHAVATSLRNYFPNSPIHCLYNLPGDIPFRKIKGITHIGVVSMHAPWKGLHTVLLMTALYEKELRELGIGKISFYGQNIYQTSGEHQSYPRELLKLCDKLGIEIVSWPGKVDPEKIFSEIDLLIHSSILPEPFGRIIIEAQKAGIPVVSTAIGGARELIGADQYGYSFTPYDYEGLFACIRKCLKNEQEREERISSASERVLKIESRIYFQLNEIFADQQG